MRIFSTFSGIGGFEIGIRNAFLRNQNKSIRQPASTTGNTEGQPKQRTQLSNEGLSFVGYSEIDKYAISVYERNFNGIRQSETEPTNSTDSTSGTSQLYGRSLHSERIPNYGDITKINAEELPDFDCLVGGFPCQAFSIAGKRGGFEDTRGTLFFDLARILRAKQPRLFVFENVKGLLSSRTNVTFDAIIEVVYKETTENIWQTKYDKNWEIIADNLSVYLQKTGTISGLLKNSKSLLDQSLQIMRKSNFLTADEMQPLELSENEWALLQKLSYSTGNIQQTDTSWLDEMVATSAEIVSSLENVLVGVLAVQKSSTTSTDSNMTTDLRTCIYALQNQNITLFMLKQSISSGSLWKKILSNSKKEDTYYVKTFNVIINALDELGYDCQWQVINSKNHGVPQNRERIIIVGHLRGTPRPQVFPISGISSENSLKPTDKGSLVDLTRRQPTGYKKRADGRAGTLDANYYKGVANQERPGVLIPEATKKGYAEATTGQAINLAVPTSQTRRGRVSDISPTIDTGMQIHTADSDMKIRRLTPIECERLQAFPDNFTEYGEDQNGVRVPISDTQRYKMCGNAVTTNVIRDVFEKIIW